MGKGVVFLLVLVLITAPFIIVIKPAGASADSWTTKEPMPTARNSLGVAVVDGKIYAIGGLGAYVNGSWETNANEEYNPSTNKWTTRKPMPTARSGFTIAVYQNKIYVIGGGVDSYYNTGVNEVYDPATDTWETKASMPTPRIGAPANVVNGKIYVIGGVQDRSTGAKSILNEVYDPATDTWTTKTPIPTGVYSYASAVVDNKIYVIGDPNLNQIYDPETDKWTSGKPIPTSVTATAAGATTGVGAPKRIYVIGGRINYGMDGTNINQVYNPEDDMWTVGTPMPTARYALAIAVVKDTLYAIGGTPMFNLPAEQYAVNEQFTPIGYGTIPIDSIMPRISILSPDNKTYYTTDIPLNFTVDEPVSWMRYSLDGQDNVTIAGNTTLTGLSYGSHNLTVYAQDIAGNIGASVTIYFTIAKESETRPEPETFPITWLAAAAVSVAVVGAGLLVYFVKVKKAKSRTHV